MSLNISYFVTPPALRAARQSGLLDSIEVNETQTTGSAAQLTGLLDGSLNAVVTAIDNLFEWTSAGADLRLAGQVEHTTPLSLIAAPQHECLRDLERTRFAIDAFANGFALVARTLLSDAGVEVEWVQTGGVKERLEALLDGRAAATLLGPPFGEQALAAGQRLLMRVQDVYPTFPGQGLIVRADLLDTSEGKAFLAALRASGLLAVNEAGLDLLREIRHGLGLLPSGVDLHALRSD